MKQAYVYILASKPNGTLYVGVTSNLPQRIWQHKNEMVDGFTKKYSVHMLVYFEACIDMYSAISREKQLKSWKRNWKIRLIEDFNPRWLDLYQSILWHCIQHLSYWFVISDVTASPSGITLVLFSYRSSIILVLPHCHSGAGRNPYLRPESMWEYWWLAWCYGCWIKFSMTLLCCAAVPLCRCDVVLLWWWAMWRCDVVAMCGVMEWLGLYGCFEFIFLSELWLLKN